ncbi:MAG: PIN domain-containing protein [Anaerolineae bacterium]|nr:PIN domain-containing protein [Anaerolineae bacterium]
MPGSILLDSSFLYALYDADDQYHARAVSFASGQTTLSVVPDVVLPEVAYLLARSGGVPAILTFLDVLLEAQVQLHPVLQEDIRRAREIMAHYADNRLNFVDCCLMALAERLDIGQVCTFDRRDFSIFRPAHCDYLELLP